MRPVEFLAALARDQRGTTLIETAIVAPVLVLMSLGAFQVSQMVARQTELQSAMAEAAAITMASPPLTADQRTTLKNVIVASTGLDASKVTLTEKWRCGSSPDYVDANTTCLGVKTSSYVLIQMDDTYTPAWTQWGLGQPINFNVDRYVMIKQS